jgi:pyruvate formate lyase activating enzyme
MKIAGLVKTSLIDYPGKVSAVVFTQGCNFRCGFCHNPDLIGMQNTGLQISEEEIFDFLKARQRKLDGVVITGGEPLLQADIIDFITKAKNLGYLVKLDTNGSSPFLLEKLINKNLVDYIAMDIKGPLLKYDQICAYSNTKIIQKSIDIIKSSGLDYEFRTTVLPHFHEMCDFEEIGKLISGAKLYTIQGFRSQITLDPTLKQGESFTYPQLTEIAKIMAPYVEKVVIHANL